jgi:ssDNA-binding Zn-finger/Zn-ribbon topoisomerase 1
MDQIDSKYIGLLSSRLPKFKRVKANLYNFRCPICGDSQRNKNKARGYLYAVKANTNFKCHNCGISLSFNNFLKKLDIELHKQFTLEKFKQGFTGKNFPVEKPKEIETLASSSKPTFTSDPVKKLPAADTVDEAREYLEKRRIDPSKFFYAKEFKSWVNTLKPGQFQYTDRDESRIIIPLYYKKNLIGIQGRALNGGKNSIKYITIMLNDDAPKIYGLDKIRRDAPVYVTEGPFDSTFIRNSIAMCGADGDIGSWGVSNPVWVYDNEPRNREIVQRIGRTIDKGDSVVIWPTGIKEKDINDMVLSGHDVQSLVESNVYSGLEAQIKFNYWKRV